MHREYAFAFRTCDFGDVANLRNKKQIRKEEVKSAMPAYIQNNPQTKIQSQSGSGGEGAAPETLHTPELGFVLDQSGSMNALVDEAILGFNTLLDEQRNLKTLTANFSLELFNHTVKLLFDAVPIAQLPPLTRQLYLPAGGTALNDAIGSMIRAIGKRARRSTRVLVAILTDGAENSSQTFSQADILQMISYRRITYDWQFVFIGPPHAASYALSIGIPQSNIVSFNADGVGVRLVLDRLSKSMRAYQLGDRRYALRLRN
jgi:uncharacterized protein YegL